MCQNLSSWNLPCKSLCDIHEFMAATCNEISNQTGPRSPRKAMDSAISFSSLALCTLSTSEVTNISSEGKCVTDGASNASLWRSSSSRAKAAKALNSETHPRSDLIGSPRSTQHDVFHRWIPLSNLSMLWPYVACLWCLEQALQRRHTVKHYTVPQSPCSGDCKHENQS